MEKHDKHNINRRTFLKIFGGGAAVATTAAVTGCGSNTPQDNGQKEPPTGKMTYRTNPNTGDKVSILGYGMMRLPTIGAKISAREKGDGEIDQEMVNRQIDYALEHGVNYFDTSPVYCQGRSEKSTGTALSRHPRKSYYIATKMSNFGSYSREDSIAMFNNSLKELQTDYIDYYLLHAIGGSDGRNDPMALFEDRYIKNGMLDFMIEKKKAGVIRNLGFSYHGDVSIYDHALKLHDEGKVHWDFVQIELNYLDWKHAREINDRNTNADYLYAELEKRGIPAVVMEPLLGGRLSNMPDKLVAQLKQRAPENSVASWAFRYAGTPKGVLTILSGMTFMEHLRDNLNTLCPLQPLTKDEQDFLESIAAELVGYRTIPCNDCKYCMPCPYGIDIPGILVHYNKCLSEGNVPASSKNPGYARERRAFLVGYDRSVPKLRQASHCTGCGKCIPACPQRIMIPAELQKIDKYVEQLKQETL